MLCFGLSVWQLSWFPSCGSTTVLGLAVWQLSLVWCSQADALLCFGGLATVFGLSFPNCSHRTNYMYHLLFAYLFIIICTIQVKKKDTARSQWQDDSIIKTRAAVPIQELMNQPEAEATRKFVEEE